MPRLITQRPVVPKRRLRGNLACKVMRVDANSGCAQLWFVSAYISYAESDSKPLQTHYISVHAERAESLILGSPVNLGSGGEARGFQSTPFAPAQHIRSRNERWHRTDLSTLLQMRWRLSPEGASYRDERDDWLQEIAVSAGEAV